MDLNEMNENWQQEVPTLAAMERINPFTVPNGYFPKMAAQLQSTITISEMDNNQVLFDVPECYFDTLTEKIISCTRLYELKENSNSKLFSVPDNYFNALEDKIKAKIHLKHVEETKTLTPKVKRLASSWITYAAAACLTMIIGLGIYQYNNTDEIETQLAALPAEEIVNYLQLYSDARDAPIIVESLGAETALSELGQELSVPEIEQYLKLNL